MAAAAPVFAVIGHGNEETQEYEERFIVPDGYTVVLLTTSGQPLPAPIVNFLWSNMKENPSKFEDPIALKKTHSLVTTPRIYEAGSKVPSLRYYPQSFMSGNYQNPSRLYTSGIYKFPLEIIWDERFIEKNMMSESEVDYIWSGDANKQLRSDIITKFGKTPSLYQDILSEQKFVYTIEEVLQMNGPGVYYFLNCRFVKGLGAKLHAFVKAYMDEFKEVEQLFTKYRKQLQGDEEMAYELNHIQKTKETIQRILDTPTSSLIPEEKLPLIKIQLETNRFNNNNLDDPNYITENDDVLNIIDYAFGKLQKKYLAVFEEQFGTLPTRLLAMRTQSNLAQKKYNGGKRKTKKQAKKGRKTRRNRNRRRV